MTLDVRQLLLSAASTGRNEEIRFLILEGGVDVNVESRSGTTALYVTSVEAFVFVKHQPNTSHTFTIHL
jgi:hypothetical protein